MTGIMSLQSFIEEVKIYPALYDTENSNYRNAGLRKGIWEKIQKKFGISNAKRKWTSLRDRYVKAKKRAEKNGGNTDWELFENLAFLDNHLMVKNRSLTLLKNQSTRSDPLNIVKHEYEIVDCDNETMDETVEEIADETMEGTAENINTSLKCGQIYIENHTFMFGCEFCDSIYNDISEFVKHFYLSHSDVLNEDINLEKILNDVNDNAGVAKNLKEKENSDDEKEVEEFLYNVVSNIEGDENSSESSIKSDKTDEVDDESQIPLKIKNPKGFYKCTHCAFTSARYYHMIKHYNKTHLQNEVDNTVELDGGSISKFDKTYEPDVNPQMPLKIQGDDGCFKCTHCDITCSRYVHMIQHYRTAHLNLDSNKYKCKVCARVLRSNHSLKLHMNVHENKRPYKCQYCTSAFTNPQYLDFHVRIHTNDRRYQCEYCDMKFIRKFDKVYHIRTYHTGEKPYQCDDCGETFIKAAKLNEHKNRKHNPNYVRKKYKCDVCDKVLSSSCGVKEHKLIHTGEKPNQCNICFVFFRKKSVLRTHMKIHGEKKYTCKICGTKFAQSPGLYSHMKTHNNVATEKPEMIE